MNDGVTSLVHPDSHRRPCLEPGEEEVVTGDNLIECVHLNVPGAGAPHHPGCRAPPGERIFNRVTAI